MDLSNGLGYAIMIAQVILLDLALGADNSAVIGMAAKNLNHKLRKKAILIGTAGAVIARFVLAVVATYLMQIPFLKTVGAVILLWIGMGLIAGEDDGEKEIKEKEDRLNELDELLADPAVSTNSAKLNEISKEQNEISERLDELMDQWEILSDQLD